jgi:hypothetical protein
MGEREAKPQASWYPSLHHSIRFIVEQPFGARHQLIIVELKPSNRGRRQIAGPSSIRARTAGKNADRPALKWS